MARLALGNNAFRPLSNKEVIRLMSQDLLSPHITDRYRIDQPTFVKTSRQTLEQFGALVLNDFFNKQAVARILEQSRAAEAQAYFTTNTHNVYLTPPAREFDEDHVFNRQIVSSKGCIAHDQIVPDSPLNDIYASQEFRNFLSGVLGVDAIYPYADELSGINVHFHRPGQELGWHFDNSSFAVTLLIDASERGGLFQYIPDLRCPNDLPEEFSRLSDALDGTTTPQTLSFSPAALVVFRGHDALHRITPTHGTKTRVLIVFAYNTKPGVGLSDSAKQTFYGRLD